MLVTYIDKRGDILEPSSRVERDGDHFASVGKMVDFLSCSIKAART